MNDLKVLVVDDESRMRKLIKDFLMVKDYKVIEAGDGEEALELFYENKDIDLIILDIMMPKRDGWSVCRQIRQDSEVPIIMLTAKGEEMDELLGFQLGVDEYISKPIDINELRETLDKIRNNACNNDINIVKSYLESKNDFVQPAKGIKRNLLDLISMLDSYFKIEKEASKDYNQIERLAHDIKIKCEENDLNNIKILAFKIELATRKKDDINIKINLDKIRSVLKSNI